MIIKNVNILTMDREKRVIKNGVVIIEKDIIVDVGDNKLLDKYEDDYIIDGQDGILIPGMVNAHTHVPMVVFRSLADDVPDRLKRYLFPLEKMLVNRELVSIGSKYGISEMLLSGVTTFADMYYFEDEVAQAAKEMGIRAVVGETVLNFPAPDSSIPYGGLEYGEDFISKWKDDDRIIPAIAPHAPYTNDDAHLKMAFDIAEKYDVPIMMHVAEMDYEWAQYKEDYNMTPVGYLDSIGVLNNRFLAAHLVHVTDDDLQIIKDKKVGISHNVGANSKGAKGVAPAVDMYNMGLKIGLGTDGPMSGNTLDIITQMGLVGKVHKLFNRDRSLFPAKEIVEMATTGGARALNLDHKIGSIEVGKKADIVIFETKSINMQPVYDYYSVLVYSANAGNVDTVIVDGEVLVDKKMLKKCNINNIYKEMKGLHNNIKKVAERL